MENLTPLTRGRGERVPAAARPAPRGAGDCCREVVVRHGRRHHLRRASRAGRERRAFTEDSLRRWMRAWDAAPTVSFRRSAASAVEKCTRPVLDCCARQSFEKAARNYFYVRFTFVFRPNFFMPFFLPFVFFVAPQPQPHGNRQPVLYYVVLVNKIYDA